MNCVRPLRLKFFRWVSLSLCLGLFISSLVLAPVTVTKSKNRYLPMQVQGGSSNGRERHVAAPAPQPGAPNFPLPNLDVAKRARPQPMQARPAVPSQGRRQRPRTHRINPAANSNNLLLAFNSLFRTGEETTAGVFRDISFASITDSAPALLAAFGNDPADFAVAKLDPQNRAGTGGVDLLSNNANWNLPLLSLPGRELDLGLGLSYNTLVWVKSGDRVAFEPGESTISPGFRVGFATIEGPYWNDPVGAYMYVLTTPSGGKVELRYAGTESGHDVYESKDSAHMQLIDYGSSLLVRPTDGTQMSFGAYDDGWHCTEIKDRNGNYLTITYLSNGSTNAITDTLGRVVNFNYDSYDNLLSITQTWAGQTPPHQWATFSWVTRSIGFPGESPVDTPTLAEVRLADNTYYTFDYDAAGYGQVSAIHYHAADNHERRITKYIYEASGTDCPRVTQERDWAENWNGDSNGVPAASEEAITYFTHDASDDACRMTMPDGTVHKEYYGSTWQSGLTTKTKSYETATQANADTDQSPTWKKKTETAWTQDNTSVSYLTNPRVTETNVYDSDGNRRRTTVDYSGSNQNVNYVDWGLPHLVKEYDADGTTEIRHTYTDYNMGQSYLDKRIIGLVSNVHISNALVWQSRISYNYDEYGQSNTLLEPTSATTIRHDSTNYGQSLALRGNVTSISRWDVNDVGNSDLALTSRVGYNTNGSVIWGEDASQHRTNISYADSFSDNNNSRNTFAYPTLVKDPDWHATNAPNNYSTVQYNFDFGAATETKGPPPAGQTQGLRHTMLYDAAGRIERVTAENNGAYTRWVYDPYSYVSQFDTIQEGQGERYTTTVWDGAGRVRAVGGSNPGSTGGYWGKFTAYDVVGRATQQTNPTEITGGWAPTGDDVYDSQTGLGGWQITYQTYDWKGRPLRTINPSTTGNPNDATYKEVSYGGCGCAGGEVVTLTDEVGRQQKVYSDALGRQWKTEVLDDQSAAYSTTVIVFDARNYVKLANRYSGAAPTGASSTNENVSCPTGTCQKTAMTYDGYGRLKTKHLPEQNANTYTLYAYNPDDSIQSVTDARGATASYIYNNGRHLVNEINYAVPQNSNIPETPDVTFEYDAAGNRTSMTDGLGRQDYFYDSLSRLTSEERYFAALDQSFTLAYDYNLAGEVKSVTDPTSNTSFAYAFDSSGRVTAVTGSGLGQNNLASNFQYRATGAVKHLDYGNGTSMSLAYNTRMMPTQYVLNGVKELNGEARAEGSDYSYYDDSRLKFATDYYGRSFYSYSGHDKAYDYDQFGRLKTALTAVMANNFISTGQPGSNNAGPYQQEYSHDAFSNLTNRTGTYWSEADGIGGTQTYNSQNRNTLWSYDASGNILSMNELAPDNLPFVPAQNTFDGAGGLVNMTQTTSRIDQTDDSNYFTTVTTVTNDYDGDRQRLRLTESRQTTKILPYPQDPQPQPSDGSVSYYVRSTPLGGKIINDGGTGIKNVYVGGELIYKQLNPVPTSLTLWQFSNPLTGDSRQTDATGKLVGDTYLDPEGVDTGGSDPANFPQDPEPPPIPDHGAAYAKYLPHSLGGSGRCALAGYGDTGCGWVINLQATGMVAATADLVRFVQRRWVKPSPTGLKLDYPENPFDEFLPQETADGDPILRTNSFGQNGHWETETWNMFFAGIPQKFGLDINVRVQNCAKKIFNIANAAFDWRPDEGVMRFMFQDPNGEDPFGIPTADHMFDINADLSLGVVEIAKRNPFAGMTGGTARGFPDSDNPERVYIPNDLDRNGRALYGLFVHEVGNSIALLTRKLRVNSLGQQIYDDPSIEPTQAQQRRFGHRDPGVTLEDCVFGKPVSQEER